MDDAVLDGLDEAAEAGRWRAYIEDDVERGGRLWVAEHAGGVCAFARTGPCRDGDLPAASGEVHGLYVAAGLTGRGIGGALLAHAVADLEANRHAPVVVWVFESNARAIRFYERAGFERDGARRPNDDWAVAEVRLRGAA